MTRVSVAPWKLAFCSFAPVKRASVRSAPSNSALLRSAPSKRAPSNLAKRKLTCPKSRAGEIGAGQFGADELRAQQAHRLVRHDHRHVGIGEVCAAHVVEAEVHRDRRIRQVGVHEDRSLLRRILHSGRGHDRLHRGMMQTRMGEIGAHDPAEGQVRIAEIGTREVGADQLDAVQVRSGQIRTGQIGATQIEAGQVIAAHILSGQIDNACRRGGNGRPHRRRFQVFRGRGPGSREQQRRHDQRNAMARVHDAMDVIAIRSRRSASASARRAC